jgi:hypothetical protein
MNKNDLVIFQKGDFMKKQLTLAIGLAVLATPAFATKARLQALGEDNYGSAYINDNRNIWLNAAQINNHKDLVTYEFGTENTSDDSATPRGEGGVFKTMGNMVYGLQFGGASSTSNGMRAAAGLTGAGEQNNIDVFVGGDAGLKWGANLGYAKGSNEVRSTSENGSASTESMRTRLGVIMGDTQAYANVNLINNAKGANAAAAKFEGDLGYQVGVIHAWEGNTLFADYRSFDAEGTVSGTKSDISLQQIQVGIGRVERLNDKTNLFTKASFVMGEAENEANTSTFGTANCGTGTAALFCEEYSTQQVPVTVGVETEAATWLTLRASVGQVIWGSEEDKSNERSIANSTIINAGATLKFGELSVDGVIGNATNVSGDSTTATGGTDSGTIRTDSLMSRVAMTYRF